MSIASIPRPVVPPRQHFIGGAFVDAADGATFPHHDPSSGAVTTTIARGQAADVAAAVRSADSAFRSGDWSNAPAAHRRLVLTRVADLINRRLPEISRLESLEMGRPVLNQDPLPEGVDCRAAWNFRFFAMEQELVGDEAFHRDGSLLTVTQTRPAGVYALITPWNGPIMMSTWKIAPCLAYGNSAVHKPSELSPLSIQLLCEIFEEAGLPAGVYNVVHGIGREVGPPLVEHRDVVGVSFTGSTATARDIATRAGASLKRTSFELGGKSANIIFDDADLAAAIPAAAASVFGLSGQACVAGSRVFAQRGVYQRVVDGLVAEAERFTPADPWATPGHRAGPLVSQSQMERVTGYLGVAANDGTVLCGGLSSLEEGSLLVRPTVVVDVSPSSAVYREEIFGPVVTVLPFDEADEAITLANDSSYGLAGYVWTGSHDRALYTATRLDAGMVWVNGGYERDLRQPFGGTKASGLGREGGNHSREFYTESHFVAMHLRHP